MAARSPPTAGARGDLYCKRVLLTYRVRKGRPSTILTGGAARPEIQSRPCRLFPTLFPTPSAPRKGSIIETKSGIFGAAGVLEGVI